MSSRTGGTWLVAMILIGAGVAVAFQIGKVPVALQEIQRDLDLSLVESSWIISIFSLIAGFGAAFIGLLGGRLGQWRFALFGMALTTVAGLIGAFAGSGPWLLATRVAEGIGFFMTVTSIPPLIAHAVPVAFRRTALSLWGLYVPVGSFVLMAASGVVLRVSDWRMLWIITSILILCAMLPIALLGKSLDRASVAPAVTLKEAIKPLSMPGPLLTSAVFGLYACQYMVLTGFLPLILIQEDGFGVLQAGTVGAVVIFFNAIGNGISGWLHGRGESSSRLIVSGSVGMALMAAIVFSLVVPVEIRIAAAIMFGLVAGLIPSSLFAIMPSIAPDASNISMISGMLTQGSAIGQLIGPPAIAACVTIFATWSVAIPSMMVLALLCMWGGIRLARFETGELQ